MREPIEGHPVLTDAIAPLLAARDRLSEQRDRLEARVREEARNDAVCRRLMTVPGVGAIIALTYVAAIDCAERCRSSRTVGAALGLTPRRHQSGETDRAGAITRIGDPAARVALFEAAHVMMTRVARWSPLKARATSIAKRRGARRAKVALARKLAVILHRMWTDGTEFRAKPLREHRRRPADGPRSRKGPSRQGRRAKGKPPNTPAPQLTLKTPLRRPWRRSSR